MTDRQETLWVIFGSLVLGGLVAVNPIVGAGGLAAGLLFGLCFGMPRFGISLAVVAAVLQYLPTKAIPILPQQAVLFDDLVMVGVTARLLADLAMSRVRVRWWMLGLLGVWLLAGVFSAVVNGSQVGDVTNALRAILLPIALMPAANAYLATAEDRGKVFCLIVGLTTLNAAISPLQWLTRPTSPDVAWGVLGPGGANGSGLLSLIGMLLVMVAPWSAKRRGVLTTILGAGLLVSSARAAIIASPAALLAAGWRSTGQTRARRTLAIVLVGALTLGLFVYYRTAGRDVNEELSLATLIEGQQIAGQGGRLLYLRGVPAVWSRGEMLWLWGVGPGGYTSFVGMNRLAPAFVSQVRVRTDSLTGFASPDMQWTALLGEYGLIGTACATALVLMPILYVRRRKRPDASGYDAALITVAPALLVVWLTVLTAVNGMEYGPVATPLWVLMGAMMAASEAEPEHVAAELEAAA